MIKTTFKSAARLGAIMGAALFGGTILATALVNADSLSGSASVSANLSTSTSNTIFNCANIKSNKNLNAMISKGTAEIDRRLNNLNALTNLISSSTKLSVSDKATLSAEVSSSISSLTSLRTQLSSETTASAACMDIQNIFTQYRVYALVDPKVHLVKVADDQQVVESKLGALASKLQIRITADTGASQATLQNDLNTMISDNNAARAISSLVESSVIGLQPSGYNSNHALLSGYNTQLQNARSDLANSISEAKQIVSALKS